MTDSDHNTKACMPPWCKKKKKKLRHVKMNGKVVKNKVLRPAGTDMGCAANMSGAFLVSTMCMARANGQR